MMVLFYRLLKALDAPRNARIYWAGGEPLGGMAALEPLLKEFPDLYDKKKLSLHGELEPFAKKASLLAAIDYIVCEKSNVFMPSHGGNMGHMIRVLFSFFILMGKQLSQVLLFYFLLKGYTHKKWNTCLLFYKKNIYIFTEQKRYLAL